MNEETGEWTVMIARFESMCFGCGGTIKKRSIIWHNHELRQSTHLMCKNKAVPDESV